MTNCPDCSFSLKGKTKCRCGWVMPASMHAGAAPAAKRYCSTVGCEQFAAVGKLICEACDDRHRSERARAANEARGLHTVEEMRAFCRKTMRAGLFSRKPAFESWAEVMTQATVDLMLLHDGEGDRKALARLRAIGALDEHHKLVPIEKRAELRAAHEAKVRAERAKVDAMLKAQGIVRREIDSEAQA